MPTRLGHLRARCFGTGRATVLLPSVFVDGHTFDRLIPLLPGRRLIVPDGPGLGESDALCARELHTFCRSLPVTGQPVAATP